jgi:hypothetical protein
MGIKSQETFVPPDDDFDESVLLNPDYYTHQIVTKIIDAPEKNPNMMIIYVNMLEKLLRARGVLDEDDMKKINKDVTTEIDLIQKKMKDIDPRVLNIMRYTHRFQHLLEKVFSARPSEGVVRI